MLTEKQVRLINEVMDWFDFGRACDVIDVLGMGDVYDPEYDPEEGLLEGKLREFIRRKLGTVLGRTKSSNLRTGLFEITYDLDNNSLTLTMVVCRWSS